MNEIQNLRELLLQRQHTLNEHVEVERAELAAQQYAHSGEVGDIGDASVSDASDDYRLTRADHDRRELLEINEALLRMQKGTYGECEVCENPIAIERLRKLPHARRCIDCQSNLEAHQIAARTLHVPKL